MDYSAQCPLIVIPRKRKSRFVLPAPPWIAALPGMTEMLQDWLRIRCVNRCLSSDTSAGKFSDDSALFDLFEQAIIDEVRWFCLTDFFRINSLQYFFDTFETNVGNRLPGVADSVNLVKLAENVGIDGLGVFREHFHTEFLVSAEPVLAFDPAAEESHDRFAAGFDVGTRR